MQTLNCRGRGCEKVADLTDFSAEHHPWVRVDAYGIYTGPYCDPCFKNNYPYRKDRYPTQETHGYGDYLDDF